MRRLQAIEAVPAPAFVRDLLRIFDAGDAALPVDPRLPAPAVTALLAALRVGDEVEEGDALVIPTSGTTGEPKGVVLTATAVEASAAASNARLGVDRDRDHWWCPLPLAHVGGLSVVLRAVFGQVPVTFVEDPRQTLASMVATQVRRTDVSRFRAVLLGGAAAPEDRPPNCVTTYGMTETGSGIAYDGVPLDGVEVRVVEGELHVRGPMLLRCYRDGTDPKDADGWLPTGDAGSVVDGVLRVEGRIGDVIVTGGEKVWPEPVERLLGRLASVAEVAVAGRPDPEWGHRVVAFVVPAGDPPTLDELRDAVKAELPAWCAPKQVVLVAELPRTALGKVRRGDL